MCRFIYLEERITMSNKNQEAFWYVEPSEELKPAIDLILRIGRDKQMRSVFEELVKTQEFAECIMKYHQHFK